MTDRIITDNSGVYDHIVRELDGREADVTHWNVAPGDNKVNLMYTKPDMVMRNVTLKAEFKGVGIRLTCGDVTIGLNIPSAQHLVWKDNLTFYWRNGYGEIWLHRRKEQEDNNT